MKLKLNAKSEMARKIAMCYVGSNIFGILDNTIHKTIIIGVTSESFVWEHFDSSIEKRWVGEWKEITIDTDTAKFDPFVAMREGVPFKYTKDGATYSSGGTYYWVDQLLSERKFLNTDWALQQEGVECVEDAK